MWICTVVKLRHRTGEGLNARHDRDITVRSSVAGAPSWYRWVDAATH